jgi:hypothetical protein
MVTSKSKMRDVRLSNPQLGVLVRVTWGALFLDENLK